jgi:nicotinamide-nucleotide amidase
MKAAILVIGDELTCGYRLDTNSQAISRRLAAVPVEVVLHLTVGDDLGVIHGGLCAALERADIVIITGGLGPTDDDLTRQTVAAYYDLPLVENAEALTRLRERFARRGRPMPESNLIQAQVPRGSQIILNDRGTAAGFYLPRDGKHIFVTPGIPYEMMGMLEAFILPRVRELVGTNHHVRRAALKVYGLPESGINERIRPLMARGRNPLLGLLPHRGTITIEVTASGETQQEAEALLAADLATLRSELGGYIISEDERDLPQVVGDLLVEQGLTIAVAEMGTSGLVAVRLTEPEGSQRWFRRGLVYGSERDVLEVAGKERLSEDETALVLAEAARQAGGADIGLGVGPVILAEDGTPDRPYGAVQVAVNLRGRETWRRIGFNGDRNRVRQWAADAALALLRLWVAECLGGAEESLSDWLWGARPRGDNRG